MIRLLSIQRHLLLHRVASVAVLLAVSILGAADVNGQQQNGWTETEESKPNVDATDSAWVPPPTARTSASERQTNEKQLPTDPSIAIRQQIGLSSFNDPIASPDNQPAANSPVKLDDASSLSELFNSQNQKLTSREGLASSIKMALLLATLSLAPAIVLMTTCYVRIVVVLTLLRQAFGAQQLPPTQVLTALSLFVTLLVMTPIWTQVKKEAIDPYTQENGITWEQAWERGVVPVKAFMLRQIKLADNEQSIVMLYKYVPNPSLARPTSLEDVPINVLLPAFMVSELKVAFLLGFQIYLPFLVLDLIVSSVTVSTGMLMLPPTMVSLPLKLILFVLVDGWNLVVGMLLQSFGTFT